MKTLFQITWANFQDVVDCDRIDHFEDLQRPRGVFSSVEGAKKAIVADLKAELEELKAERKEYGEEDEEEPLPDEVPELEWEEGMSDTKWVSDEQADGAHLRTWTLHHPFFEESDSPYLIIIHEVPVYD